MAQDKDSIEPVEGITASRNEEASVADVEAGIAAEPIAVDDRSLNDLAAEMVVEDMSEAPEMTAKTADTSDAVHPDFEGMDPAVLSANQDIQKFQLMEYLEMMMTLREAQRQDLLSGYFKNLYENSAQNGPQKTGWAIAGFMEPKHFREVEEAYPEIAQAVTNRVVTRLRDEEWSTQLAEKSGFTKDEFSALPNDFKAVLAATAEFERDFPPLQGNTLSDRLSESKPSLMEGLKSPAAMKALQFASWGFAIATGGVAMKLGVMGVMEGIKRLSSNPSVQQFAKDALQTGVKTLTGMGVPMDDVVKGLQLVKESTRSVWSNPKVKFAAAAMGAVAVGLILSEFDFSKVAEAAKPLASNLGELGDAAAKTAGSYVDLVGAVATNSADIVSHAASTAYDAASSAAGGALADVATELAQAGHDLAGDGATVTTVEAPENLAAVATPEVSPGFEEAKKAAAELVSNLGDLGDSASKVVGSTVDAAGSALEETGNATLAAVDNAGNTVASAYDASKQVAGGVMADMGTSLAQTGHDLAGNNMTVATIDAPAQVIDADDSKFANRAEGGASVDSGSVSTNQNAATSQAPTQSSMAPATAGVDAPAAATTVTIEKGDTLSHIAVEQLKANGIEVNQQNIKATWEAIYEANKDVLTQGPHKILPGMEISITADMLPGAQLDQAVNAAPSAPQAPVAASAPTPAFTGAEEEARKIIAEAVSGMDAKSAAPAVALPAANVTQPGLPHSGGSEFLRSIAEKAAKHAVDTGPSI